MSEINYWSAASVRHVCGTCEPEREFATRANARRHVEKYHREPAVLLRDTPEDRERLLAAFDEAYDWCEDWGDKHQHIGCVTARGADAIIAALRGEA